MWNFYVCASVGILIKWIKLHTRYNNVIYLNYLNDLIAEIFHN